MSASPTDPDSDASVEALIRQMIASAAADEPAQTAPTSSPCLPSSPSSSPPEPVQEGREALRADPTAPPPRAAGPAAAASPVRPAPGRGDARPSRRRPQRPGPAVPHPDDAAGAGQVDEPHPAEPPAAATGRRGADVAHRPRRSAPDTPGATAGEGAPSGPLLRVAVEPRRGILQRRRVALSLEAGGCPLESALVRHTRHVPDAAAWMVGRARRCGTISPGEEVTLAIRPASRAARLEPGLRAAVAAAHGTAPRSAACTADPAAPGAPGDDMAALLGGDGRRGGPALPLLAGAGALGAGIALALMLV